MPAVPYKPFPTVEPSLNATPSVGLNVPGAAFGANTAEAIKGLGGAISGVSDEASKIALSYQALQNDTWAKDADTNVMIKIGQADSDFKQLEGQNAVSALQAHQERIKAIRQEALEEAPNSAAKRMLDATITRRVGFAVVDAGNYAGTQAKVAANNASSARLQAAQETFNPENPRVGLQTIDAEVRHQGEVHGADPDTVEEGRKQAASKAWMNGITKMAPSDPQKAREIFDKVKDQLDPGVRDQLQNIVNRNMAIHGTRQDADEIMKGFDPMKGPGELGKFLDKAKEMGEKKGKDNPDYSDYLENRVRAQFNLGMAAYRDSQFRNKNVVEGFVMGQDPSQKIVSIDGVAGPNAPSDVRFAYNALSPDGQRSIQAYIAKESKLVTPYTPERQSRYNELKGMAFSDPSKFAELSLLNEDLPRSKIDDLFRTQRSIKEKAEPDSGLNRALGNANVRSVLSAAGIGPSKDEDKATTYNQFVGGFQEALNEFKAEHNKMPNDKELKVITQDLLTKVVTSKGFIPLFNTEERRFEAKVPSEDMDFIKQRFKSTHDREPTDDEIRALYLRAKHFPTAQ